MNKKWKNHDFWRGLSFPILSSPRPDFHQNFLFSRPPTGKINHKSDNIPFLDFICIPALNLPHPMLRPKQSRPITNKWRRNKYKCAMQRKNVKKANQCGNFNSQADWPRPKKQNMKTKKSGNSNLMSATNITSRRSACQAQSGGSRLRAMMVPRSKPLPSGM